MSVIHSVLYSVCMNADLLIHDHIANTLEHAEIHAVIFNAIKVGVPTMCMTLRKVYQSSTG